MAKTRQTFNDLIAANKRNSTILIFFMTALLTGVGLMIGWYAGDWIVGAVIGVTVILLMLAFTWGAGSSALLTMAGAHELDKNDDPQLFNVVDEISIAAGIPMPKVYVIDSQAMNAFATGTSPEKASVAITRGLREKLTREELQGVMAHDIGHIRNYDIRFSLVMIVMAGAIALLADFFLRSVFWSGGRRRSSNDKNGNAQLVLLVVGIVLMILAPLIATLIRLAMSRQREYLADASAVEFTRNPAGLAGALAKLGGDDTPLEANQAMESMYIVNPKASLRGGADNLLSTHPPIAERVRRLRELQG